MFLISLASAVELDRAPYLQSTSPTSTHVVWWTVGESEGQVIWGPAGGELDQVASSATAVAHDVEITGLEPGTTYDYRVQVDADEVLGEGRFTTNPPVGDTGPMRIWVLGDSGTGKDPQIDVFNTFLKATAADVPTHMFHLGDMAYFVGNHDEFSDNFFGIYADFLDSATVWPTLGNHEAITSNTSDQSGPYFEGYVLPTAGEVGGVASGTEAYYSFDLANMHVIVLDSSESARGAEDPMGLWLSEDLAATTQPWVIAFWHHPPYSKGTHDSDTEDRQIDMRENMLPILEAGGVDLVMAGHSHLYERSYLLDGAYDTPTTDAGVLDGTDGALEGEGAYTKPDGATPNGGAVYVVAGHGGTNVGGTGGHPVMAFHEVEWGSVLLDIDDDHLTGRNLRIDGTVTDEFTLIKGDDLVLHGPDGEANFAPGDTVPITWTMVGDLGTVDVEWTCDGEIWESVAEDVAADASAELTMPALGTRQARVRISAGDESDSSDAPFGILQIRQDTLIDWGSTWSYSDQDGDLGTDWVGNGYDDSAWASGPGELGFGDGDETTELVVGQPSFYFRHTFTVDEPLEGAVLNVLYDDGVGIWLNGDFLALSPNVELLDYEEFTNYASSDNKLLEFPLDVNDFREGENVISVMVKQADAESTDLSFDMEIAVDVLEALPPCVPVEDTGGDSSPSDDTDGPVDDSKATDDRQPYDPRCCRGETPVALFLFLIPFVWRRR